MIVLIGKKKTSFDDRSRSLPIESLGAAMRVFGEELGSDSEFGMSFDTIVCDFAFTRFLQTGLE